MNVLIASYLVTSSPSGVVTYYQKLAADLARAGYRVHIVDSSHTPTIWRKVLGLLKRIMRPLGGSARAAYDEFAYFTGVYLSVRHLRHSTFDLIHAQDARSGVAAWLALGKQVPVILSCHFNDDPVTELALSFSLKPRATARLASWYRYLFSSIHHYVFSSEYAYSKSKHLLPVRFNKHILYNTVDLRATTDPLSRCPSDQFRISNVGYIDQRKNQQLLLRVGHQLRQRGHLNFTIWLIGEGPQRLAYEHLAYSLGLAEQVRFYGHQAAPWALVAQSDLYVHTALNDNCPFAILEAFAVGTPVLALAVGGIPEMVPVGSGLLPDADVSRLTDEVIRCFQPSYRAGLAVTQSTFAHQRFDHQTNLEKLLLFYRQAVKSPLLGPMAKGSTKPNSPYPLNGE
ncbi:glycosyltransferase family 4 protein [Spirosoma fluviale]|uniref:Glycosyltransferase involved in cell wall bisynthesis n=1 Tax=Spirosoma fluviale TaxID=1597977 RepID=A0A286GJ09_9BACT|nr:glycosyltransferase family 4 protein [Spirosoma fluviale]SOD95206.1 Glycosyltransferase involved in cell wall bisynthesis [Spirosoma fluviale]